MTSPKICLGRQAQPAFRLANLPQRSYTLSMNDPMKPINRIKDFVAAPLYPRAAAAEPDEPEEADTDAVEAPDEDSEEDEPLVGDGGDDGDEDDGDGDDGDEEEDTPENYLRTKVCVAMEEGASLTFGKAIVHEDPLDEDKLLLVMQLDKFVEDEEMPDLDGMEMRDVSVILIFEGKGHEGPRKRIISLEKLSQLFDSKNWKKNNNKKQ